MILKIVLGTLWCIGSHMMHKEICNSIPSIRETKDYAGNLLLYILIAMKAIISIILWTFLLDAEGTTANAILILFLAAAALYIYAIDKLIHSDDE